MIRLEEDLTPIPLTLNVPDIARARLAQVEPTAFTRRMYLTLNVVLKHMDPSGLCTGLTVQELADAAGCSKRTIQRGMNDLGILGWIVRKPQKITRRYNEPNRYQALPKGALGKRRRLRAKPTKKAVSSAGDDSHGSDQSSHDLSRCAAPVALALPPDVIGDGVASRPADPEGREGGMVPVLGDPSNSTTEEPTPTTGPAQREIPEKAADDAHDDLDVIGPRGAHALPDPISALHRRIQETLIAADAGDLAGDGYEGRIARRFPHHAEHELLQKIRLAGQLRKLDIFKAGTRPCVWTSGNVDNMRAAFWKKLDRAKLRPVQLPREVAKPIPGTRDADGYFVPEKTPDWQIKDLAGEDRARAQNPAQGSGSGTPALPRVDASPARAHLPAMSTEAAVARVRAALAASYHDVAPLAEHATDTVARTIVDRHAAGGANGGRLAVDDVCAVIAQYATFNAFKAKRNEMVPPPATLLRFLYAEIRNAQPGCAKTIIAKLAETKFTPAKGQRQAFNKQPGESLAHLDRPKVQIDPAKLRELLTPKPRVVDAPKPPPKPAEVYEDRVAFMQRMKLQRERNGRT